MHLWIAATIAFCCVIVTEAQAQPEALVGGWEQDDEKSPEVKALADKALIRINKRFRRKDLVLYVLLSARYQMVEGKKTELVLIVGPEKCKESRTARCQQQQKNCEVIIWKKLSGKLKFTQLSCE